MIKEYEYNNKKSNELNKKMTLINQIDKVVDSFQI